MKPSKVIKITCLSILGLLLLSSCYISVAYALFDKKILEEGSFLEFATVTIGGGISIIITAYTVVIIICGIIQWFIVLIKKADREWEDSQIK